MVLPAGDINPYSYTTSVNMSTSRWIFLSDRYETSWTAQL